MSTPHISNRDAIAELIARYAHTVDSNDWQAFSALWDEGCTIEHPVAGTIDGIEEMLNLLRSSREVMSARQHYFTNVVVTEVDDSHAHAEWDGLAAHMLRDPELLAFGGGHYNAKVVRRGYEWQFSKLTIAVPWTDRQLIERFNRLRP